MGTSVNQRSPANDNWLLVQDIYQDATIPVEQAIRILWRAASNQNEANLANQLARPEIGTLADFAASGTPAEVSRNVTNYISHNKVASLAGDIAKRAAMQCAGKENARELFSQRLFAEATSYLVSRDLPGYVGRGGRFPTAADAQRFTRSMMETTSSVVRQALGAGREASGWESFAASVVGTLRRRR